MPAPARSSPWLRTAGFALAGLFLVLVARFWHPVYGFTRFLQLDASNDDTKIAAFKTEPVYVYRNTGGYDGLYYAQIAYHPALDTPELGPATDNLAYRARRILAPALAWLLAAGRPAVIVKVYSLLNVAAWLVLAVLLWRLLGVTDWRGWLAWAGLLFSAGALGSVRFALVDLVALAILAGSQLAVECGRAGPATALLAAAGLARETSLLALPAVWQRPWLSPRNLGRTALAVAPLVAWLAYIRWRVGPADAGWGNFALPFSGLAGKWRSDLAASLHPNPDHRFLTWSTLLATLGFTVQAVFILRRWRPDNAWWRLGAAYLILLSLLGPAVWTGFPGAATRVLLPLSLAFGVLAVRTCAAWGWLVAGNLSVFSGVLMMTDVHRDPNELAAARIGDAGVVARSGAGWFGLEHSLRHRWSWSDGHGAVQIETWPRETHTLRLEFGLRGFTPCLVTVSQDGVVLWRGPAGLERAPVAFDVPVRRGAARLEFMTDSPAMPVAPGPDARRLAFAVYDLRIALSQIQP
jgi:hypothetical protein